MSTLRQQLAEMQQQLDLSVQARKATQIIEKCNVICSKTDTVAGHFARLKLQYPAMQQLPHDFNVIWSENQSNELKNATNSVKSLQLQWRRWLSNQTLAASVTEEEPEGQIESKTQTAEEPTAYDIIQNDSLTNCISQLLALYRALNSQLDNAWDEWQQELRQQIHVDGKMLDAQRKVSKLNEIAVEYQTLRDKFDTLIQTLPDSVDKILRIRAIAEKLNSLRGMMKTDWPAAVQHFFDRINGPLNSKPTLSDLTTDVFEWLRNEDMLEDFVITRK